MTQEYEEEFNIMAGDTNLVLYPQDKNRGIGASELKKQGLHLKEHRVKHETHEVYRFFKKDVPTETEWTHETIRNTAKGRLKIQTWIDHFWSNDTEQILDIRMDMDFTMSDHRPMFLAPLEEKVEEENVMTRGETRRKRKLMADTTKPEEMQRFKTELGRAKKLLSPETHDG
eukprot:TRINITY_DN22521_c0_g1_i1.p1 TRINITY_DN22521_c0_g1~~TRINITY_DN22521_c0_g1_i1.p1  ORF type:complete len:172 (+),score=40.01 TRINITY_DN22521_c0_g1_i1:204-719(+)